MIQPLKSGLTFGVFLGSFHLLWAALVLVGWAQPLMDFLFWLHFIKPVYAITGFEWGRALGLCALTTAIGFVMGCVFAWLWNRLQPTNPG